jgi:hypothetical protein
MALPWEVLVDVGAVSTVLLLLVRASPRGVSGEDRPRVTTEDPSESASAACIGIGTDLDRCWPIRADQCATVAELRRNQSATIWRRGFVANRPAHCVCLVRVPMRPDGIGASGRFNGAPWRFDAANRFGFGDRPQHAIESLAVAE